MKFSNIGTILHKRKELILVIVIAIGFFFFTSFFNYLSQDSSFRKWLSPDETANYTVAKLYAETGSFQFFEKYNLLSQDIIHPRSFRSDLGWIKPMSFIGLPFLYGSIGSIFGTSVLPYLTPFFGALGIIFFYLLVKELFSKQIGLISALLLAVFPVYTYFSARSFFHNILFIVAMIVGSYLAVIMTKKSSIESSWYFKRNGLSILVALGSGLAFGIAIITRTSELIWVGPLLLGLYIFNIRKVGLIKLLFLLFGMLMAMMPAFYWNQVMYGSWYSSGYPELNTSLGDLTSDSAHLAQTTLTGHFYDLKPILLKLKTTIFHFGLNLPHSLKMFDNYVIKMFPWLWWAMLAGILLFLIRFKNYSWGRWLFLLAWFCFSAILIMYYGSWTFYDNPDPTSFTIGNSYTRYWLPFYLGGIIFTSFAIVTVTSLLRRPSIVLLLRGLCIAVLATISLRFVWLDPDEGIAISITKQAQAKSEWTEVLQRTEPNSVIITRYHDKVLFPERKVIVGLFNDKNIINEYANLVKYIPVYYYNFSFSEADFDYLNSGPLREHNVELVFISKVTEKFSLYRLRQQSLPSQKTK